MERGYVKLYRKRLEGGLWANPYLIAMQDFLLLKAAWKETDAYLSGSTIRLNPGEVVFGRKAYCSQLQWSESRVRSTIEVLLKIGFISTIKTTSKFTILSIINWDTYQVLGDEDRQQKDQQAASKPPANRQQTATYKELKKVRIKEVNNIVAERHRVPPTLESVKAYCLERGNSVDADKWFDHYSANGWKVGKNTMKDWQAAIRTWEKNGYGNTAEPVNDKPAWELFQDVTKRANNV